MKVLVVDDDSISRKALVHLLGSFDGLRCSQAEDGEQAWQQLQNGVMPLLVCCDVRMPVLDGLGLLQRLREYTATRDLPFVLVTSANDGDTVRAAAQYRAAGFLVKPFHHEDARQRLAKVLEAAQLKALEPPAATQRRLNLAPERHQAYLRALQGQLAPLFAAGLEALDTLSRRARLEALQSGLTTLGLWRAGSLLGSLSDSDQPQANEAEVWAELQQHFEAQLERAVAA